MKSMSKRVNMKTQLRLFSYPCRMEYTVRNTVFVISQHEVSSDITMLLVGNSKMKQDKPSILS